MIENLTDTELHTKTQELANLERLTASQTIEHLVEVYERKLALKLGYSSLYDYVRSALKYKEASAYRRVAATKLAVDFPETIERLKSGDLGICTAAEAWRAFEANKKEAMSRAPVLSLEPVQILKKTEKRKLLTQICNKPVSEVRQILKSPSVSNSKPKEKTFSFVVELNQKEMAEFDRVKDSLSHKVPSGGVSDVFKYLIGRELKKQKPKSSSKLNAGLIQSESINSRYISIELRRQVLKKYNYRCNFHSYEGTKVKNVKRCSQKRFLDIDHIRPVSKSGKTEFSNLQPLCSNHNRVLKRDRCQSGQLARLI